MLRKKYVIIDKKTPYKFSWANSVIIKHFYFYKMLD